MPVSRRAVLGATAVTLASPALLRAETATRRWRMITSWGKNLPGPGVSAERLAKRITEMSQGAIEIEVFAAGVIVPPFGVLDAVSSGAVEIGHSASFFWAGKMAAAPLFTTVPFGLRPTAHIGWLAGDGQALWDELYRAQNVKPLIGGNTGPSAGGWFKRELTGLADLKGLRIRAAGLGAEVYNALSATAIAVPPSETYQALERGVIDAVEQLAPVNDLPTGLNRIATNYYFPGFDKPNGASETLIGLPLWQALPASLQSVVAAACHAEHDIALGEAELANGRALGDLVAKGTKLRTFPADIVTAARTIAGGLLDRIAGSGELASRIVTSYRQAAAQAARWDAINHVND